MEFAVITGTVILCLGVFQISKTFEKQKPTKVYMFIDSNGNRVYLEQKTFFDNFKYRQINKNIDVGSIESIHGSFMFINKKRFKEIGQFDKNFFLYFEETDYCKRALSKNLKSYQINSVKVQTQGRTVIIKNKKERSRLDNVLIWHFIWSKYYFTKKNYGTMISLLIFLPILLRITCKIIFYQFINKEKLIERYQFRLNGLMRSIMGKSSNLRP